MNIYKRHRFPDQASPHIISYAVQLRRCSQESKLCLPGETTSATTSSTKALQAALGKGLSWAMGLRKGMFVSYGEIAQQEGVRPEYVRHLCSLSLLSPDVLEAIVRGTISENLTLERLKSGIPTDWKTQKSLYIL